MMARFFVRYEPTPGKIIPMMFESEADRQAFIASKPGRARPWLTRATKPKKAVCNVRMPHQIGAQ